MCMYRALLLCCALIFLVPAATRGAETTPQVTPEDQLAQANEHFLHGDHAVADMLYTELFELKPYSAGLLYNKGLANLKQKEYGWAVLYFRQALWIEPRNRTYKEALHTALDARKTEVTPVAPTWLHVVWESLVGFFTLSELAWASFVLLCISCGLGIKWLRSGDLRRRHRWLLWCSVGLWLAVTAVGAGRWHIHHDPARVVVIADTRMTSGPGADFPVIRDVYAGETPRVLRVQGMWLEVRGEAGPVGWLDRDSVERVMPVLGNE